MLDKIRRRISVLWKEHICDTFPYGYDEECVMCKKESCVGCPLVYKNKLKKEKEECGI